MLAGGLLGDGGLGALGRHGDAGGGLLGLGDAGFGDGDAQVRGGGHGTVVGVAQSGRGGLGRGRETVVDGGRGFGLHGQVLS